MIFAHVLHLRSEELIERLISWFALPRPLTMQTCLCVGSAVAEMCEAVHGRCDILLAGLAIVLKKA